MGKEQAPAISTHRNQAEIPRLAQARGEEFAVELTDDLIHQRRPLENDGSPITGGMECFANPGPAGLVGLAQRGIRQGRGHAGRLPKKVVGCRFPVLGSPAGSTGHLQPVLYSALSPRSSLRIRMASSMRVRKIFPSPILPVFAVFRIISTTRSTR